MITWRCGVCGSEWFLRGRNLASQRDVACGRCAVAGRHCVVAAQASDDPTMMDLFPPALRPASIDKIECVTADMPAAAGRMSMSIVTVFFTAVNSAGTLVQMRVIAEICRHRRQITRLWGQHVEPGITPLLRLPVELRLHGNIADVALSYGLGDAWDGNWQAMASRGDVVGGKA